MRRGPNGVRGDGRVAWREFAEHVSRVVERDGRHDSDPLYAPSDARGSLRVSFGVADCFAAEQSLSLAAALEMLDGDGLAPGLLPAPCNATACGVRKASRRG